MTKTGVLLPQLLMELNVGLAQDMVSAKKEKLLAVKTPTH
jgi:hypothetical protein